MVDKDLNLATESELGYGQLLAILLRRKFWFLSTFVGVLAVAAFMSLTEEPIYQSSMRLIVEPNYEQDVSQSQLNGLVPAEAVNEKDYATQLTLMRSGELLQKAVDSLRSQYPDLSVDELQRSLSLSRVQEGESETRIVEFTFTDDDPVKTGRVLETLKEVYLEYNLAQQELRLSRGLAIINRQLEIAQSNLDESQNALKQFRQQQRLIDPTEQSTTVSEALNEIEQQQQELQTEYQDVLARYAVLQQQLSLSPQSALIAARLNQSPRYQTLLNELLETELQLANQRVLFLDSDPTVQSLLDQRQNQLSLLREEASRILRQSPEALDSRSEEVLTRGQLSEVDVNLANQLAEVQVSLAGIEARRASLEQPEQQLRARLNQYPDLIAEYDRLQPEVETRRGVLQKLLEQREQLRTELARGGYNWQIVASPQEGWKVGPNPLKGLMLGGVVGLFLGGAAAFGREALDRSVHTSAELKRRTALPLLGILPKYSLETTGSKFQSHLPFYRTRTEAPSFTEIIQWQPFREALDLVYKSIQLTSSDCQLKSLMITSALPSEGKSTLTMGLALSAARLDQRVLVIDADLRNPTLDYWFGLSNQSGLSSILAGDGTRVNPTQVFLSGCWIDILTSGAKPDDPVKLISSQRMRELVTSFESKYDLVLVNVPSVLGMADALQIASYCSGIVLIAQLDHITQMELDEAKGILNQFNVLGIVANGSRSVPGRYTSYPNQNGVALLRSSSDREY